MPGGVSLAEYVAATGISSICWRPGPDDDGERTSRLVASSPVPVVVEVASRQTPRQYAHMIDAGVCGLHLKAGLARAALDFLRRGAMIHVRYPVLMRDLRVTLGREAERFLHLTRAAGRASEAAAATKYALPGNAAGRDPGDLEMQPGELHFDALPH